MERLGPKIKTELVKNAREVAILASLIVAVELGATVILNMLSVHLDQIALVAGSTATASGIRRATKQN
jgi:hypothetical protein